MDPDRWRRMWELFHEAEELDPSEREAFLERACAGDADLRDELRSLLAQADRPHSLLDRPAAGGPGREFRAGEAIRNYRIVRRLAEGGMGVVYEAAQDEPVRRRVALKLIRPGLSTREVLARFQAERQALAMLDHPSIARVYDAGETEDGRPFFAMELVEGLSILTFCDSRCLDTDARLRLFAQVCDAVQHAHRRGVIHRDLKPSNILISTSAEQPLAKVIDFGVARATGVAAPGETSFTLQGQIVGTPEYMSPEQAGTTGEDVDTRTDVYALGAILYELLAGSKPFDWDSLRRAGYEAMWKVIREDDPPPPSRRLGSLGQQAATIATCRGTDPPSLVRRLHGELDWVVMRCLEKERERRYDSASDLVRDLERYRRHHPVQAGPPSAAYRARKFVRRHRVAVASGFLILLAVLVGFGVGALNYARAVDAERESARSAEVADEVSNFLVRLFDTAAPNNREAGSVSALEVVRRGVERVDSIQDTTVRARLTEKLGWVLVRLGSYEEARTLLEANVAALTAGERQNVVALARAYNALGAVEAEAGQYQTAREHYERTLELTADDPERHASLRRVATANLVKALRRLNILDEARDYQLQIVEYYLGSGERKKLAGAYRLLSMVEVDRAELLPARDHARLALELYEELLPQDAPEIQYTLNSLGIVEWRLEDYEASRVYLERASRSISRTHGPEHPYTASTVNNLGRLMIELEQWDEAERLTRNALAVREKKLDPNHPDVANSLLNLATLMQRTNRPTEALPLRRRAVGILEVAYGENSPRLTAPLEGLATLLDELGRPEEATEVRSRVTRLASGDS